MDSLPTLPSTEQAKAHILPSGIAPSPISVASRTLLQSPEMRIVLFAFSPGQELPPHSTARRAWVCIIEGQCEFFFNGQWHTLSTGAALHLPPGHTHAVKATDGPFVMTLTLGTPGH